MLVLHISPFLAWPSNVYEVDSESTDSWPRGLHKAGEVTWAKCQEQITGDQGDLGFLFLSSSAYSFPNQHFWGATSSLEESVSALLGWEKMELPEFLTVSRLQNILRDSLEVRTTILEWLL